MHEPATPDAVPITVYWRPGCPFCSELLWHLDRSGLVFENVNIWADPDAAAFVRSVASGNEVVPTVTVGVTSLVNPSMKEILALHNAAA